MAAAMTRKNSIAPQPIRPHQAVIVDMINGASTTIRIFLPSCADVAAVRVSAGLIGLGLLMGVAAVQRVVTSWNNQDGRYQGLINLKAVFANLQVTTIISCARARQVPGDRPRAIGP